MLSFSTNFQLVCVVHKQSNEVIFFQKNESHPLNIELTEKIQSWINQNLQLADKTFDSFELFVMDSFYNLLWSGKYTYVILILTQNPGPMEREMVQTFGLRLESRFSTELEGLYTTFLGNIDIFLQDLPTRQNLRKMAQEIFHIKFTKPYIFKELKISQTGLSGEICDYIRAKMQTDGFVYLSDILTNFENLYPSKKLVIQEFVFNLIKSGNLVEQRN